MYSPRLVLLTVGLSKTNQTPMRSLTILTMTALSLTLPDSSAAAGEPATCGGLAVTIDLNDPGAPDPDRDAADVVLGTQGDDHIVTGGGNDDVCAAEGEDTGRRGADYLRGGPDTDRCIGGPGRNRFQGCE